MRWFGLAALAALTACNGAEREPVAEREATASAEQVAPAAAAQTCKQFPQGEDDGSATRPEVPASLASFVTATETTVTVERRSGTPACIDIAYGEVDSWDSFAQGRLLGVGISGHEYNSYLVVDRESAAKPIETGRQPVFSRNGKRFASVDVSESAFGAFEALGVWEVEDRSVRTLQSLPGAPLLDAGGDWRLERWASDDCLIFSAEIPPGSEDRGDRRYYELVVSGPQDLRLVARDDACSSPETARP